MMKSFNNIIVASLLLLAACGPETKEEPVVTPELLKTEKVASLKTMESKLYGAEKFDESMAMAMVNQYADYVKNFPDDTVSADYLFKAGEISSSLRQGKQAIDFFQQVYDKYPTYRKAHYCLFLQAFVYETQLKDLGKAKEYYTKVIEKYPNEHIAGDAKASIDNLGKSDEELVREFEAKNKLK